MRARLSILHSADMQRGRFPVDLLPPKVCDLRRSQPMPVGTQEHSGVPVTISVALCGLDQFFDLSFGEVLSAAELAVRLPPRGNCSFFDGWRDQLQVRFAHGFRLLAINDCSYNTHFT